jgi:hypothetical protein
MATLLQDTLGMQGTTSEASFEDFVRGQTGTGCAVTITGTGADFPNGADANAVIAAMEAAGWTQDNYYAAGGPTANIIGFTKGNELCLYQDTWAPPAGVECPTNTPIGECVEPEQRQYTITLNCATITQ